MLLWGYVGLIDGLLNRLKAEPGMAEAVVIIGAGGLASTILPHIDAADKVDHALTMTGLRIIFNRNKG